MKINKANYEIVMMDYFDGKLNAAEVSELLVFVNHHPEIKKEFEAFENTAIEPEKLVFTQKDELRKPEVATTANINETNYEDRFVAFYENDLTEKEQNEVLAFVAANPGLKSEFEFHKQLKLTADAGLMYNNKAGLKRKAAVGIYWQLSGIAAALLILFGIFTLFDRGTPVNDKLVVREQIPETLAPKPLSDELNRPLPANIIQKQLAWVDVPGTATVIQRLEVTELHPMPAKNPGDLAVASEVKTILAEKELVYDITFGLAENAQPERRNALGRVIQNLARKLTGNEPEQKDDPYEEPVFVKVLGKSITVFNTITGSDTELVKSYDQSGNLTSYFVEGESVIWSRDIVSNRE